MGSSLRVQKHATPFRYLATWQVDPSFREMLNTTWKPEDHIATNLANFTIAAIKWNRKTFGIIRRKKVCLLAQIQGIENTVEFSNNDHLFELEQELKWELETVLAQEKIFGFRGPAVSGLKMVIVTYDIIIVLL
ncbi:hypothetical protein V6N13_108375 [Hibiscus sabdariffa]|uniref:Uncharacterized protein n=1 Tax=Hibiscus sabdariffa TaxID=183260 RepID=A0ABR2SS17_9ROSI